MMTLDTSLLRKSTFEDDGPKTRHQSLALRYFAPMSVWKQWSIDTPVKSCRLSEDTEFGSKCSCEKPFNAFELR